MIRIVKGNPFCLRIKLTDISIDLTQATSLNLRFVSGVVTSYDLTPSISSPHVFEVRVEGDLPVGVYMIELVGKYGGDDFRAAYADALSVVHTNQQADLAPTDVLEVQTIDLTFEGAIAKGADGRSAYQVAVDNGFVGTEAEWLASLKGERGPQGAKGEQGEGITPKDREVLDSLATDETSLSVPDKTFVADKALFGQVATAETQTNTIKPYGDEEHALIVPEKSGTIATTEDLGNKQDTLVSGTNIKTVNGQSILGSGNITIDGGSIGEEVIKQALRRIYLAADTRPETDINKLRYNDTGADIVRTAEWGEEVTHKAGHYWMNGLGDITEEQMAAIYAWKIDGLLSNMFYQVNIRTNYPWKHIATTNQFFDNRQLITHTFASQYIEVACWPELHFDLPCKFIMYQVFNSWRNCKKVVGVIDNRFFHNFQTLCANGIEDIKIKHLSENCTSVFNYSERVTYNSFYYIIHNAVNTAAITITVHPTTYAYFMGEQEPTAQVGGTSQEWQELLTYATEHNINIAK